MYDDHDEKKRSEKKEQAIKANGNNRRNKSLPQGIFPVLPCLFLRYTGNTSPYRTEKCGTASVVGL